jgi:putative transposase
VPPIGGMARKPRDEFGPGVYHVYARGNDRQRIFVTEADRIFYLDLLGKVTVQRSWRTLAYCLMGNHVHMLIETVAPNLAAGMQRLHGRYAQRYNQRHGPDRPSVRATV